MVFVPIHHHKPEIEPTPGEAALLHELAGKGLAGEALESALAAQGVEPGRARALAKLAGPRTVADQARGLAAAGFWVLVAILFGAGRRPLERWLRENHPGSEWVAELVLPVIVGAAVLWTLLNRLRTSGDAPQGTTRADQVENKPIG